ncbi:hypothetical protein BKA65DRAFT_543019 [Rhexocercosporidium sp. MPI-PUGE-AT-0058]|nr:hypothetical protein BKA65DRAFT_543019 [Rhexocercosporidium sp. MPI-PUGE-AT-0058]
MGQFQRPFGRKQRSPQGIPTQAPVPLDPRIPSIAQLPDEAVLLILNFVDNVTLLPVPWTLLQRIPSHTRLHTTIFAPEHDHEDQEQVWTCLTRLHGNRNLFSLSIHIVFQDEHRCRVRIQALKRVLLSCPRLARIPNLYVGPVHNMICGLGDGPLLGAVYCGLGFCRGEIPPALEELGVRSYFCYPWGQEQTFAFGPDSIYTLEITPRLTSLKEVSFEREYWNPEDQAIFLEAIPVTLETLNAPSWDCVSNKSGPIAHHGATLRNLAIHPVLNMKNTGKGYVTVTCPDFSAEMNAAMKRMSKEKRTPKLLATTSLELSLEIAVDGPLSESECWGWTKLEEERKI